MIALWPVTSLPLDWSHFCKSLKKCKKPHKMLETIREMRFIRGAAGSRVGNCSFFNVYTYTVEQKKDKLPIV